jgi:hypothetical protein
MDDLRERFHALDDVSVPDRIASLPPLPDRAGRRPSAVRRAVTAMVAVVLAVGSFVILARAFGDGPSPERSVGAGSVSVEVGSPIVVGDGPNAVAAGAGAVWVSALPGDGPPYRLVRLDPTTGGVVARIPVPALPTWEVGGGGLSALPEGVWVTGAVDDPEGGADAIVYRVDPATDEVAERIDLGPGFGADVWVDGSGLWVLVFEEGSDPGIAVVRLDPVSFHEVARTRLPTDWAKQVFAFDGSIWVHGNRDDASEGAGVVPDVLFQIDPATNRYVGTVDLPSQEFPLAVDGTSIWQRTADGVTRIDPKGSPTRIPLDGMEEFCCSHIASDRAGGLWVVARGDGPRSLRVSHVSADGQIDARAEVAVPDAVLESVAMTFDAEHETLWLVQYERTVTPLHLSVS